MDTVSDATRRLQAEGYTGNWYATADGSLQCGETNEIADVEDVRIDHILRFEGQSDPGDEVILYALQAPSGARGVYSAAYGADMSTEDATVIARLPRQTGDGTLDGAHPHD
jgi:hypothetical protein